MLVLRAFPLCRRGDRFVRVPLCARQTEPSRPSRPILTIGLRRFVRKLPARPSTLPWRFIARHALFLFLFFLFSFFFFFLTQSASKVQPRTARRRGFEVFSEQTDRVLVDGNWIDEYIYRWRCRAPATFADDRIYGAVADE